MSEEGVMRSSSFTKYRGEHCCTFCADEGHPSHAEENTTTFDVAYVVDDKFMLVYPGMLAHYLDDEAHAKWGDAVWSPPTWFLHALLKDSKFSLVQRYPVEQLRKLPVFYVGYLTTAKAYEEFRLESFHKLPEEYTKFKEKFGIKDDDIIDTLGGDDEKNCNKAQLSVMDDKMRRDLLRRITWLNLAAQSPKKEDSYHLEDRGFFPKDVEKAYPEHLSGGILSSGLVSSRGFFKSRDLVQDAKALCKEIQKAAEGEKEAKVKQMEAKLYENLFEDKDTNLTKILSKTPTQAPERSILETYALIHEMNQAQLEFKKELLSADQRVSIISAMEAHEDEADYIKDIIKAFIEMKQDVKHYYPYLLAGINDNLAFFKSEKIPPSRWATLYTLNKSKSTDDFVKELTQKADKRAIVGNYDVIPTDTLSKGPPK